MRALCFCITEKHRTLCVSTNRTAFEHRKTQNHDADPEKNSPPPQFPDSYRGRPRVGPQEGPVAESGAGLLVDRVRFRGGSRGRWVDHWADPTDQIMGSARLVKFLKETW